MKKDSILSFFKNIPGIVYALLILVALLSIFVPDFRTIGNIFNITQQGAVLAIIAMASCIITVIGGIDLSLGAVLSLSGMVSALLLKQNCHILIAILGGIVSGLVCGIITGIIIAVGRIPSFVATLGMMSMCMGVALGMAGGATIAGLPDNFYNIANGSIGPVPYTLIICLLCYLILNYLMKYRKFGLYVYALGGNPLAARCCGINNRLMSLIVYGLAGALSGLAGVIMASRLNCGHPTVGIGYEFEAVVAVVVGGSPLEGGWGSLGRTLVGVLVIQVLKNGLSLLGYPPYWQMAIVGVGVIVALVMANMAFRDAKGVQV